MNEKNTYLETVIATKEQAKWWAYAAWTLPFVALGVIAFEHYIGLDTWLGKTIVAITVVFFTISVYWWWWALNKIVNILTSLNQTTQRFNEVKEELRETRKTIREIDASNREWREQNRNKSRKSTRTKSRM